MGYRDDNRPYSPDGRDICTNRLYIPNSQSASGPSISVDMLAEVIQPYSLSIAFTSVDFDTVSWTSGNITFADGTVVAINSGSMDMSAATEYLYFELGNADLQVTSTMTSAYGADKAIVAILIKGTSGLQDATVHTKSNSQQYVGQLSGISADFGYITAGEVRIGTGTLGSNFTGFRIWVDSGVGRFAGYSSDTMQVYLDTDGKLYAGGGTVSLDSGGANFFGSAANFYKYGTTDLYGGIGVAVTGTDFIIATINSSNIVLNADSGSASVKILGTLEPYADNTYICGSAIGNSWSAISTYGLLVKTSQYFLERAAADTSTATFGQIWVKNDTPNTLWFTDDAGTDHPLLNGGGDLLADGTIPLTANWDMGAFIVQSDYFRADISQAFYYSGTASGSILASAANELKITATTGSASKVHIQWYGTKVLGGSSLKYWTMQDWKMIPNENNEFTIGYTGNRLRSVWSQTWFLSGDGSGVGGYIGPFDNSTTALWFFTQNQSGTPQHNLFAPSVSNYGYNGNSSYYWYAMYANYYYYKNAPTSFDCGECGLDDLQLLDRIKEHPTKTDHRTGRKVLDYATLPSDCIVNHGKRERQIISVPNPEGGADLTYKMDEDDGVFYDMSAMQGFHIGVQKQLRKELREAWDYIVELESRLIVLEGAA